MIRTLVIKQKPCTMYILLLALMKDQPAQTYLSCDNFSRPFSRGEDNCLRNVDKIYLNIETKTFIGQNQQTYKSTFLNEQCALTKKGESNCYDVQISRNDHLSSH